MHMLADTVELVIGVDTHKDAHTAAVVVAATGAMVEQLTVSATPAGYQQLLQLAGQQPGQRVWAIEGTGGYGAGLTRFCTPTPNRWWSWTGPRRAPRRHGAKSDPPGRDQGGPRGPGPRTARQPRAAGQRAALSVRLAARRSAVQAATDGQRQLHALVVAAPEALRGRLRNLTTPRLVTRCARVRLQAAWDIETAATAASLRALARRIQLLHTEIGEHTRAITALVQAWRPDLLRRCGVGPIVAASILCVWSHPGRCGSDAAFAMLAGAAPIPASSGLTVRVRLNRSGDRQLNQALHLVVLTRLRYDPATRAYAQRRRAQGKTNREIRRCLVGYVARQLYRLLEADPRFDPTGGCCVFAARAPGLAGGRWRGGCLTWGGAEGI
jgi:transposase